MKVFIATPCYDGRVDAFCAAAIMRELSILREAGIDALWFPLCGCCYLPVARNKLVREFLATDCTDLVFVDSDVYFEPGAMLKLLLPEQGGRRRHLPAEARARGLPGLD